MTALWTSRDTTFLKADRNKDGDPEVVGQRCAYQFCVSWIDSTGCDAPSSLLCEDCHGRFSNELVVELFGMKLCGACAVEAWAQYPEPDCQCCQTDVDQFSACGCEIHNPSNEWNELWRWMQSLLAAQCGVKETTGRRSTNT